MRFSVLFPLVSSMLLVLTVSCGGMKSASLGGSGDITEHDDTIADDFRAGAPYVLDMEQRKIVDRQNEFGMRLYQSVLRQQAAMGRTDDNVVVSPLSMSMNLEMLTNGAVGETRNSVLRTLGIDPDSVSQEEINKFNRTLYRRLLTVEPESDIAVANSMWFNTGADINPAFTRTCREYYYASSHICDLSTVATMNEINGWISKQTRGLIPSLLETPLDPAAIFTLINTVYFNSSWNRPFDKNLTKERDFHNMSGDVVKVDMMDSGEVSPSEYYDEEKSCFTMVGYGFSKGVFEMQLILPDEGKTIEDCLDHLLKPEIYKNLCYFRTGGSPYELFLPKFEIGFRYFYRNVLSGLGASGLFGGNSDLSLLSPDPSCHVSEIIQEVKVITSESEVKAAAVTMDIPITSTDFEPPEPRRPIPLVFDRPFLFMIVERGSGAILFIGDVRTL